MLYINNKYINRDVDILLTWFFLNVYFLKRFSCRRGGHMQVKCSILRNVKPLSKLLFAKSLFSPRFACGWNENCKQRAIIPRDSRISPQMEDSFAVVADTVCASDTGRLRLNKKYRGNGREKWVVRIWSSFPKVFMISSNISTAWRSILRD